MTVGDKSPYRSLMDGRLVLWKDVFHGMDVKSDRQTPTMGKDVKCLTVLLSVYCIAHYGFWSFLLKVIFSP